MDLQKLLKPILTLRFNPTSDLLAVLVSCLLVTGALYSATFLVGSDTAGGIFYFLIYAIVTAALLGIGLPLYWMVVVRKRPLEDLGITRRYLGASLFIQLVVAGIQYLAAFRNTDLPAIGELLPLLALALTIGFFEAVFWRGWVLLRLEEAFGLIPALLLGSALYALYHIGYGMPLSEMVFLFFIGLMFALVFRLTKNVFILWPLFQPMGQLITLLKDGLSLPSLAALGFFEVLIVMGAMLWLAARYSRKHARGSSMPQVAVAPGH